MALTDLTGLPDSQNNDSGNNSNNNNGGGMAKAFLSAMQSSDSDGNSALDLLVDYNERYKNSGNIMFRDNVIKQTLSSLICKNKPNALLVGQAGVGKTKIVEDIAYRLANDDVLIPDQLKGYTIYELPISNIMSGSSLLGQLEEKVQTVIDFISDESNKAILFIDELHLLVDGDRAYMTVGQLIKPALARGNFRCIGATTLQESASLFKDPAFNRRFTRIIVDELTQSQTVDVLKNCLPGYLKHYNSKFSITDQTLELIVPIADQYAGIGSHRPDNAFTLLDRTIAEELLARKIKEIRLTEKLSDPDPAVACAAQQALAGLNSMPSVNITENKIRNTAIRMMKGNSEQESIDFDELQNNLSSIKGQDDVISKLIKIIKHRENGLFPSKKPTTILFTGTSGVGKTEITKIFANTITGKAPIIINMTEYSHASAVNQIIGSNVGYLGSDSKTELPFDCLESNPYQIILLDEFEKGHKEVQRLFMRVFDEGLLKTNRGTTIDFSKAIIIATTNAAHKEVKKSFGFGEKAPESKKTEIEELKKWFDPELLNRFEHIVNFNPISADTYIDIIKGIYAKESARIMKLNHSYQLKPEIDPADLEKMRENFVADFGARPAFNTVREYIENQI